MDEPEPIVVRAREQLESAEVGPDGLVSCSPAVFDIRVAPSMIDEACALLSSMLSKLDDSGLAIQSDDGSTTIIVDDVAVPVQFREEVSRLPTEVREFNESEEKSSPWRHKQFVLEPCGELSLIVFGPAGRRYLWAGSSRRLSGELDEVILQILGVASQRRRLRQSFDPAQDSDKIRELESAMGQWRRAERIREFVAAARSSATTDAAWLEWATAYANSIDPLRGGA